MRITAFAAVLAAAAAILTAVQPAGAAATYAPVTRPGPALGPSSAALARAVTCSGDFHNGKQPVLLVPGTAFTYQSQYAWSWAAALTRAGVPWCAVTPPYNTLGDLTIAGEYDVYAIRHTYALAKRKIAILGHSQGAMRPRWALRFWPDTRTMVATYIAVAPDNQGVSLYAPALAPLLAGTVCAEVGCPQGVWQQLRGSNFIKAINSIQQTFPGINYSVIYSTTDELVAPADTVLEPATGTSYRRAAIQSVCPGRVVDHFEDGTVDAVVWAMIMDALTHNDPVDPAHISKSVCGQLFLPGLEYAQAALGAVNAPVQIAKAVLTTPRQRAEAQLPCYVFTSGCPH